MSEIVQKYLESLSRIIDERGEEFNLYEENLNEKGQLQRFLKLSGIELDHLVAKAEALAIYIDVDRTDADYLTLIADLVGLEINYDIPIPQQREEIKRAVEVYKTKGTVFGIERVGQNITGLNTEVGEWAKNILISNDTTRRSSPIDDAERIKKTGLPGDPNSYCLTFQEDRGDYSPERFGIYFTLPLDKPLLKATVDKLNRVMQPEYIPAGTWGKFIFLDGTPTIVINTSDMEDSNQDVEEDVRTDVLFHYLTSNELISRSNNKRYKSAHLGLKEIDNYDIIYRRFLQSNTTERTSNNNIWRSAEIFEGAGIL